MSEKGVVKLNPTKEVMKQGSKAAREAQKHSKDYPGPKDAKGQYWYTPDELRNFREGKASLGTYPKPKTYYQDMTNDDPAHGLCPGNRPADHTAARDAATYGFVR